MRFLINFARDNVQHIKEGKEKAFLDSGFQDLTPQLIPQFQPIFSPKQQSYGTISGTANGTINEDGSKPRRGRRPRKGN